MRSRERGESDRLEGAGERERDLLKSWRRGMAWVGRELRYHQVPTPLPQAWLPTFTFNTSRR